MNFDDEEDIPVLLDTAVKPDDVKPSDFNVEKPDDFRVPLTIVTGTLQRPQTSDQSS